MIETATAAAATFLANGGNALAAQATPASSLEASPEASPQASPEAGVPARPDAGTENQTRGQGDQLRIIWWQAPTTLAPHAAGDSASNLVFESLLTYFPDGSIQPVLLEATPTVENGLLAKDLSLVTLKLRTGLLWSDGEPVTANDIVFTWKWIVEPANTSTSYDIWNTISDLKAVDDLTAVATYDHPLVNWFDAFTGNTLGVIYTAHAFNNDSKNRNDPFLTKPIGTGPYKVESFTPNDQGTFIINDNYREENKPFFSSVLFKGGGDAVSAGRAVVQTGEFDFAWNVQAAPAVITEVTDNGTKGRIVQSSGATLEVFCLHFSD
ncbi:MAG: ABC transporter substrate-binding protein, partial [Thermomicrobiales bacterium]